MDALATFLQQSITFFAILDPIGISAIALSILSPNITKTQINKVAYKANITIIIAFFVVLISGEMLLKLFDDTSYVLNFCLQFLYNRRKLLPLLVKQ